MLDQPFELVEHILNLRASEQVGIVDTGHALNEVVEFPRFGGHRLTERVSVGKDVCHAEDPAVFVGVPS